ncbi:MAG: squalene/phytoene synthase family protein [Caulobacteraceae bacterium]|nr:squalene/phytoene synthase family protein [Caulobacteraceae bacterium]
MEFEDDLDATVRRADPDRWLASRFIADEAARADVVALYALNIELSRIAEVVREPLMGEIRLTWWREAIDELFAGRPPRGHPVVQALATAITRRGLAAAPFVAMIEARFADFEPSALSDLAAAEAYLDGAAGALMALAVAVLGGGEALAVRPAAQAWGLAGLARLGRLPEGFSGQDLRRRVDEGLDAARKAAAGLPVAAFPAVAYAGLARPYAAGRTPSELEKRLRLTLSVLTGRI